MKKSDIITKYKETKAELAKIEGIEVAKQTMKELEIEYDSALEAILRIAETEKIATMLGTVEIKNIPEHEAINPRNKEKVIVKESKKIKVSSNAYTKKRFIVEK